MTALVALLLVCSCASAFASFMALRNWRLAFADAARNREAWETLSRVYWKVGTENMRQREVIGKAIERLNTFIDTQGRD